MAKSAYKIGGLIVVTNLLGIVMGLIVTSMLRTPDSKEQPIGDPDVPNVPHR